MAVRRWFAVVVAALLVATLTPLSARADGFAATMPDPNFRACVTDKLGLDEGAEPSPEQLAGITDISCTSRGIADATGVEALPNLTKLFLGSNQLTDVTPLATATKVFSLGLQNNQINDVSALSTLTELTTISLDGNRLADISVLGTLPRWQRLFGGTRHGQQALAPAAVATQPAPIPTVVAWNGTVVQPETPEGATVSGGRVTYAEPGTYVWTFRDPGDLSFNGSVTVEVSAPSAITVPDDALRACLNTRIEPGRPAEQQPTAEELARLTGALTCSNKGVADLTGLNLATGLDGTVNLSNNSITDLSPISALVNVRSLNLFNNDITSLVPLGSLPNLTSLSVQRNATSTKAKLVSLAGVDKLTGLTSLTVNYQGLTSLAPLAGHQSLTTLYATDNLISDVSPLAGVPLTSRLDLQRNRVGDLSPLNGKQITTLNVTGQQLSADDAVATVETDAPAVIKQDATTLIATPPDGISVADGKVTYPAPGSYAWTFEVKPSPWQAATFGGTITQQVAEALPVIIDVDIPDTNFRACLATALDRDPADPISAEMLAGLDRVSCVGQQIADITGAELLTGATELTLSSNKISDLAPLTELTQLTKLLLPSNQISDLAPLAGLTSLRELNISYNPFTSIAPLAELTTLQNLDIAQRSGSAGHPGIDSLTGVAGLTELTNLNFNNSRVSDLAPLVNLTKLTNLIGANNSIGDISALAGLTALTHVNLRDNQISDVSALSGATDITHLGLAYNRITDLSPLGELSELAYLQPAAASQQAQLPPIPAEFQAAVPRVFNVDGTPVAVTPPAEVDVVNGTFSYPQPGTYTWTFQAGSGSQFNGTITQEASAPVPEAAHLPDANLRACLTEAAGLEREAIPTVRDLADVEKADCSGAPIADLTGIELLTAITDLDLSRTGLSSVAPLAGLTTLTALTVDGNQLRDLSALAGLTDLTSLSARDQVLHTADTPGGVLVPAPGVTTRSGQTVAAVAPAGAEADGGAVFSRAGSYTWPFTAEGGAFTGTFTTVVTTDVSDDTVHTPAAACLADGNVWVVVERDTGLQEGGCATEFADGLQALHSAGFTVTGTGFITHIGGYPTGPAGDFYWSYWHASDPEVTQRREGGDIVTTSTYDWVYAQTGPAGHEPQPGSIEGWRFIEYVPGEAPLSPSWRPVLTSSEPVTPPTQPASPTPEPTRTLTPTPAPVTRTAPYTLPGLHRGVNGRDWLTTCEPYSQTERCRTEIWAMTVVLDDGRFVRRNAWVFNNLTYLPLLTEQQWRGNPLGDVSATSNGLFTSAGRQWRTECHTATTGRGGCRSYTMATVYTAAPRPQGGYVFGQQDRWVFNNMVLFRR